MEVEMTDTTYYTRTNFGHIVAEAYPGPHHHLQITVLDDPSGTRMVPEHWVERPDDSLLSSVVEILAGLLAALSTNCYRLVDSTRTQDATVLTVALP